MSNYGMVCGYLPFDIIPLVMPSPVILLQIPFHMEGDTVCTSIFSRPSRLGLSGGQCFYGACQNMQSPQDKHKYLKRTALRAALSVSPEAMSPFIRRRLYIGR